MNESENDDQEEPTFWKNLLTESAFQNAAGTLLVTVAVSAVKRVVFR